MPANDGALAVNLGIGMRGWKQKQEGSMFEMARHICLASENRKSELHSRVGKEGSALNNMFVVRQIVLLRSVENKVVFAQEQETCGEPLLEASF